MGSSGNRNSASAISSSGSSCSRKFNNRVPLAIAIPGNGVVEQVTVGGLSNFLSIYNNVITARILLTWIPQAQGVAILQPVFQITDPYLNLFRGLIPPIFGLDLSPLLAFFALSVAGQATAAIGHEIPDSMKMMQEKVDKPFGKAIGKMRSAFALRAPKY
eukprot:CAMPEP_0171322544 /NCGR_PEP_ID=MMETSP0816-20121228/115032_1 /TAXON_ID=420281 /ORGANISM="Proboscia inermis, Strain CCAP1064/1" /LENGTH=159 /DNA_ID=CAMNT_0011821057 /DNA_START=137 /DNA_END=616 /DNA_ORIENTATION=+